MYLLISFANVLESGDEICFVVPRSFAISAGDSFRLQGDTLSFFKALLTGVASYDLVNAHSHKLFLRD